MTELVLYHAVPSRSMTVHWMLEELGEPYRLEMLDLQAGEQQAPDYLSVNPMGKVPALRHGDVIVTETAAICAYLAETFPAAGLEVAPGDPERGAYLAWLFFAPVTAEPAVLWKALPDPPAIDAQPFADVETVARVLREHLRDREFAVAGRFTAADVMLGSLIMWSTRLMPVMPGHPELLRYWENLERRPAWQRAFGDDQRLMPSA